MHFHPELPLPEALEQGTLRIVPLGGLGEVGRNMAVFEYNGRLTSWTVACSSLRNTSPGLI